MGDFLIRPNNIVGVCERNLYVNHIPHKKLSSWRNGKDILKTGMENVCY